MLQKSNYTFKDLDAVAVSKGPGSYTGLRIGVSTAKGFCFALNIPLISINTLQHMAAKMVQEANLKDCLFCPMLDARRMEVYCAIFDSNNKEFLTTEAKIIDDTSFANLLNKTKIVFFGDGAAKCKPALAQHSNAIFRDDFFPSSRDMVELAYQKYMQQHFENTAYFEPFYLKDFLITAK